MMNTIKMNFNYRLGEGSPLTIDYLYTDLKKVKIHCSIFANYKDYSYIFKGWTCKHDHDLNKPPFR